MASALRKMAVYLGMVEEELDYADDDYDAPEPARTAAPRSAPRPAEPEPYAAPTRSSVTTRPAPGRPAKDVTATTAMPRTVDPREMEPLPAPVAAPVNETKAIMTKRPGSYSDARPIGEAFREGIPIILDLTEMPDAEAKRVVDFAAGLTFGLQGRIDRVTHKVFLLSPADVDVVAQVQAAVSSDGFFNQS